MTDGIIQKVLKKYSQPREWFLNEYLPIIQKELIKEIKNEQSIKYALNVIEEIYQHEKTISLFDAKTTIEAYHNDLMKELIGDNQE